MNVTRLLATRSLRTHRTSWAAVFAALALTSLLLGAFALIIGCTALGHARVERYAGADLVVSADQTTRYTAAPAWGTEAETAEAALTERVRVPREAVGIIGRVAGVREAVADDVFSTVVGTPPAGRAESSPPGAAQSGEGRTSASAPNSEAEAEAVTGRSWPAAELAPYGLTKGRAPHRDGEVVVSPGRGRAPGDRVTATPQRGGKPRTYDVVGIADGPAAVYFTASEARALAAHPGSVDAIGVLARPGVGTADLHALVRRALERADVRDVTAGHRAEGDPAAPRVLAGQGRGVAENLRAEPARTGLLEMLAAVSATLVMIALLIVASLVAQALQQRAGELALLRAVGATPRQLRAAAGLEVTRVAAWAAVPGAAVAVPAYLGLRALLKAQEAIPEGLELPTPIWLFAAPLSTAALTVGAGRLAALFACARIAKIRPAQALGESRTEPRDLGNGRRITGLALLFVGISSAGTATLQSGDSAAAAAGAAAVTMVVGCAVLGPWIARGALRVLGGPVRWLGGPGGRLAAANCRAHPRRLGAAVTPIVLVTAFTAVQLAGGATMRHQGAAQAAQALHANLAVTAPGLGSGADLAPDPALAATLPEGTAERVRAQSGVAVATEVLHGTVVLARRQGGESMLDRLPALGVTPRGLSRTLAPDVAAGTLRDLRRGTVSVGTDRARSLDLRIGSTVRLRFGDGAQEALRVAAIHRRSLALGDFLFSRDQMARHMTAPRASRVLIATERDAAPRTVRTSLEKALPGTRVERRPAPERLRLEGEEAGSLVTGTAVAAIGAYTAIAILSTLTLITVGRRPELALLRLVGAGRGQLRRMLRAEAAVVTLAGLVLGASVAAVPLFAFSFATVRALPYLPPVLGVLIVAAVGATAYAGVLVPARRALGSRAGHGGNTGRLRR